MTYEEKMRFLRTVQKAVKEEPSLFGEIVVACNYAVDEAIATERKRAADMETIAVAMHSLTTGKYREKNEKWVKGLILGKLEKWNEDSYLGGWEMVMDELRGDENE